MTKRELKNKYLLVIILACVINVILLIFWFYLRAVPVLYKIDEMEDKITNIELANSYDNFEELELILGKLENDYDLLFTIENYKGLIKEYDIDNNITLFYKLINIDSQSYLIRAYSNQNISLGRIFIELFVFEVIVVIILLLLIFLFARQTVFKPVDKIINDIKKYMFGQKPFNSGSKSEFGFIKSAFLNLTHQIDEEKQEQTRIIASINHDIKTPLTSIIGYSDLMIDNKLSEDERIKYATKINEKALHINDILATFDDYLLNQEKNTLKKDIIQIKDLINELYNDYKIELENKNIQFLINTNIENENINVDLLKIKRIFANIIANSIRYLEENGKITIDILDKNDYVLFVIKDNGPGVDKKILNKIFDPLFTTDYSRKISGLGLSICKEFVEMHDGTIKGYNNNGFVIEFTIPKI